MAKTTKKPAAKKAAPKAAKKAAPKKAAAKQAAAKHSARVFALKQVLGTVPRIQTSWSSMSKNVYSNAKPDSLPRVEKTYVAKFSFAFYRTSYYADKDIPDSKIIWDAFCRQREEHFRLHKADKAIISFDNGISLEIGVSNDLIGNPVNAGAVPPL